MWISRYIYDWACCQIRIKLYNRGIPNSNDYLLGSSPLQHSKAVAVLPSCLFWVDPDSFFSLWLPHAGGRAGGPCLDIAASTAKSRLLLEFFALSAHFSTTNCNVIERLSLPMTLWCNLWGHQIMAKTMRFENCHRYMYSWTTLWHNVSNKGDFKQTYSELFICRKLLLNVQV